ncbi:hypothetical protein SAM19_02411 [Brevibacillus laterosporus]|nr:hypothetical protein [Brevibacillus laterosporus]
MPTITGSLLIGGGTGGSNVAGITGHILVGGGGGACGGSGGNGGGVPIIGQPSVVALPGQSGHLLQTIVPVPENLFIVS